MNVALAMLVTLVMGVAIALPTGLDCHRDEPPGCCGAPPYLRLVPMRQPTAIICDAL